MKVEDAAGPDQKIYSQTIPHDSTTDVYLISDQELINGAQVHANFFALQNLNLNVHWIDWIVSFTR